MMTRRVKKTDHEKKHQTKLCVVLLLMLLVFYLLEYYWEYYYEKRIMDLESQVREKHAKIECIY